MKTLTTTPKNPFQTVRAQRVLVIGDSILEVYLPDYSARLGGAGNVCSHFYAWEEVEHIAPVNLSGVLDMWNVPRTWNKAWYIGLQSNPWPIRIFNELGSVVLKKNPSGFSTQLLEGYEIGMLCTLGFFDALYVEWHFKDSIAEVYLKHLLKLNQFEHVFIDSRYPDHFPWESISSNCNNSLVTLKVNEVEAARCGRSPYTINKLVDKYGINVLVTHGANGATLLQPNNRSHYQKAISSYSHCNPLGCGDSYFSSYGSMAMQGYPVEYSMLVASYAGGIAVSHPKVVTVTPAMVYDAMELNGEVNE